MTLLRCVGGEFLRYFYPRTPRTTRFKKTVNMQQKVVSPAVYRSMTSKEKQDGCVRTLVDYKTKMKTNRKFLFLFSIYSENSLLLPGILRSANWLLLSVACSVLADVRYENAKMAARRITNRVQSRYVFSSIIVGRPLIQISFHPNPNRSWFPADAKRRHRGEYINLVQGFR